MWTPMTERPIRLFGRSPRSGTLLRDVVRHSLRRRSLHEDAIPAGFVVTKTIEPIMCIL